MGKQYKSVLEMVDDIIKDGEFKEELKQELINRELAHTLFAMRCVKGITQEEMALSIGCDESKIDELENSSYGNIKVSDLIAYIKALCLLKERKEV